MPSTDTIRRLRRALRQRHNEANAHFGKCDACWRHMRRCPVAKRLNEKIDEAVAALWAAQHEGRTECPRPASP